MMVSDDLYIHNDSEYNYDSLIVCSCKNHGSSGACTRANSE